jgi:hypothetical protein
LLQRDAQHVLVRLPCRGLAQIAAGNCLCDRGAGAQVRGHPVERVDQGSNFIAAAGHDVLAQVTTGNRVRLADRAAEAAAGAESQPRANNSRGQQRTRHRQYQYLPGAGTDMLHRGHGSVRFGRQQDDRHAQEGREHAQFPYQ